MQTTSSKTAKGASIITFLVMMLFALPTSAQGVAEVWLNKALQKLQNKGAEMSFRIDGEGMSFSGKLLMEENKFHYDSETIKIWYDGTTQWTLQSDAGYRELYISQPDLEDLQIINPCLLLKHYKEFFTITDGGEKTIHGKLTHMVTLNAISDNSQITDINVYIDNYGVPVFLELMLLDGMEEEVEIRSMRDGLTFPKNTFTYSEKDYPADEVIDMR